MKFKRISLLALVFGFILSFCGAIIPLMFQSGPILREDYHLQLLSVCDGLPMVLLSFGIAVIISAAFCLVIPAAVKTCCSIKTSAMAVALSAVGGAGLTFALIRVAISMFNEGYSHPIKYPLLLSLMIALLLIFIALIIIYCRMRKSNSSATGFVIDVLTSVIYLPAFFCGFTCLYNIFS